jgi:addiction module RelB/DinJ family antitoxin
MEILGYNINGITKIGKGRNFMDMENCQEVVDLHTRVNPKIKKEAEQILQTIGLSLSDYINLALYQVRINRKVPFELVADPPFPYEWLGDFEQDVIETHQAVANGTAEIIHNHDELREALYKYAQ